MRRWAALISVLALSGQVQAQQHRDHGAVEPPLPLPTNEQGGEQSTRPVTAPAGEEARAPITVTPQEQARVGLQTSKAQVRSVRHTIRTVGIVTVDESKQAHVHSRVTGWIDQMFVAKVGDKVTRGQPLYALYSPDLLATQQEYVSARGQGALGRQIAATALQRLRLWGVPEAEIHRIEQGNAPRRAINFHAPIDGHVIGKTALLGMYVTPELELFDLADLSRLWVIARLYEADLAAVAVGDTAAVRLPYDPAKRFTGKISYIYPEVDPETRTAKARIELANSGLTLKPGMYADVEMEKELGQAIVVPDDAVIDTGLRKLVFVKRGTQFEPREVQLGSRVDNVFVVRAGLLENEEVVTSAVFLIDAESKIQAVLRQGGQAPGGHGEHGKD